LSRCATLATVSAAFHHVSTVRPDGASDDRVVTGQGIAHPRGMLFPQTGRTLQVGEDERHRPRGKLGHVHRICNSGMERLSRHPQLRQEVLAQTSEGRSGVR